MDLISQLQEHTNHIAFILFDTIGSLQRDAQPSPVPGKDLPEHLSSSQASRDPSGATGNPSASAGLGSTPGAASATAAKDAPAATTPAAATPAAATPAAATPAAATPSQAAAEPPAPAQYNMVEDVQARAGALVKALKLFDDMVAALPEEVDSSEQQILEHILRLHRENEQVGQELARELEAAEEERQRVGQLFGQVAAHALNGM